MKEGCPFDPYSKYICYNCDYDCLYTNIDKSTYIGEDFFLC